jgi:hypothetical protein
MALLVSDTSVVHCDGLMIGFFDHKAEHDPSLRCGRMTSVDRMPFDHHVRTHHQRGCGFGCDRVSAKRRGRG